MKNERTMAAIVCCGNSDVLKRYAPDAIIITADEHTTVPTIAAQLMRHRAGEQHVLVLDANATTHASALGFSQRAARNPFRGYILINPMQLPAAGVGDYDWPDAPIAVVSTSGIAHTAAELRGWRSITCAEDAVPKVIAQLASEFR